MLLSVGEAPSAAILPHQPARLDTDFLSSLSLLVESTLHNQTLVPASKGPLHVRLPHTR